MAFVVVARWIVKEGEEGAVERAVRRLIGPSREEPGNLIYEAHRDPSDPRVFFFYEQYADRAAAEAHRESPHFQRHGARDALPRLEARERSEYLTVE